MNLPFVRVLPSHEIALIGRPFVALLWLAPLAAALAGCGVVKFNPQQRSTLGESLAHGLNDYCALTPATRALVRASLERSVAPHLVVVTCAVEVDKPLPGYCVERVDGGQRTLACTPPASWSDWPGAADTVPR